MTNDEFLGVCFATCAGLGLMIGGVVALMNDESKALEFSQFVQFRGPQNPTAYVTPDFSETCGSSGNRLLGMAEKEYGLPFRHVFFSLCEKSLNCLAAPQNTTTVYFGNGIQNSATLKCDMDASSPVDGIVLLGFGALMFLVGCYGVFCEFHSRSRAESDEVPTVNVGSDRDSSEHGGAYNYQTFSP